MNQDWFINLKKKVIYEFFLHLSEYPSLEWWFLWLYWNRSLIWFFQNIYWIVHYLAGALLMTQERDRELERERGKMRKKGTPSKRDFMGNQICAMLSLTLNIIFLSVRTRFILSSLWSAWPGTFQGPGTAQPVYNLWRRWLHLVYQHSRHLSVGSLCPRCAWWI